jgi:hypothetical protein
MLAKGIWTTFAAITKSYIITCFGSSFIMYRFIVSFILPFPISLVAILLALLLINIFRKEIALRKSGMGGIKELYKSLSSASNSGLARFGGLAYTQTKFYCMNCGREHRKIACP